MTVKPAKVSQWLGIQYPDEGCDPFFDQFDAMVVQFEEVMFFRKMFENCVVGGGGTRVWNGSTGLFSWSADFTLVIPHWGFKASLQYGPDGVTRALNLQQGQCMVVELPMGMNANIALNFSVVSQLNQAKHNQLVIAARIGSALHLRNVGEIT